jgi:hypothetical protein
MAGCTTIRPGDVQISKTMPATMPQQLKQVAQESSRCVSFNIRKATRAVTHLYDERLRPFGLRSTQLPILGTTLILEPVTVTRLTEVTVTDRTTMTRNLRLLEQQGPIRVDNGNGNATPMAERLAAAFGGLNARVRDSTGGVDLKLLLPLTLFLLGLRELLAAGKGVLPTWYDLLWFAFGTFFMLNPGIISGRR